MNLDSFLGKAAAEAALPEPGFVGTGEKASRPESHADPSSAPEASGSESAVTKDITPNGTEVAYRAQPRTYWVNGVEVPSVTTVLNVLRKDNLGWWGMQKGVQGVLELFNLGALTTAYDWDGEFEHILVKEDDRIADEPAIVDLLKAHKLTVNHRLDQASERGVNVHDALEAWARHGFMPNPEEFPESERGYVEGLVKFLEDVKPIPIRVEVMVGSVSHGFAGRFDLLAESGPGEREYTSRCYPKRKDKRDSLSPQTLLLDLKTSKGVYDSHKLQLAAYELAAVECGYPATDGQAVLHVTADGKYELVFSDATPEQFLAVKAAYDALEEL